jgi:hypothetical protein
MRLYFHLVDATKSMWDDVGVEVGAEQGLDELVADTVGEIRSESGDTDWEGWSLQVADDQGQILFVIPLG